MSIELLEGGDQGGRLLDAYDPASGTWALPKEGEFWDSVALAHRLGRTGRGRRIAVVDGAFDTGIPALAEQRLADVPIPSEPTDHGTAVALLIHEVAPDAELVLWPISTGGRVDRNQLGKALRALAEDDLDVVNLSLGEGHDWREVEPAEGAGARPDSTQSFFDYIRWFSLEERGRSRVRTDHLPLAGLARRVAAQGTTVVAAIGNRSGTVYSPAIDDAVVSCGFQIVRRSLDQGGEEVAWGDLPSFDQSAINADVMLPQPEGVLGSSYSSPLVAAFATLVADRAEFPGFLESARLAGLASAVEPSLGEHWDPDSHGVLDVIYREALLAVPHTHWRDPVVGPCPECALLARPVFVDWGLFKAKAGDFAGAVELLRAARAFAPFDVHAAANLGVVLLESVRRDAAAPDSAARLAGARRHLEFAVAKRPEHGTYAERLREAVDLQQRVAPPAPG